MNWIITRSRGWLAALALSPFLATSASAQGQGFRIDRSTGLESNAPASSLQENTTSATAEKKTQPTEITASKETTFDEKTRTAVFVGDVTVKDAQFHLTCQKMTAHLAKSKGKDDSGHDAQESGGLEKVIAEGDVIIVQDKVDEKGKTTRYVAKAARAEYDTKTGNLTLRGWPQVSQGINTQVATSEGTVMILNRTGTLRTDGPSRVVISDGSSSDTLPGRKNANRPANGRTANP